MATDEQRETVRSMAGAPVQSIANVIGVSLPTLRKAFAEELRGRQGPELFDAEMPVARAPPRKASAGAGGRKPFAPTPTQRDEVAACVAMGMSRVDIARAMGISEPTLAKHFAEELATGAARVRMQTLVNLQRAARKGSVPAQREVLDRIDQAELEKVRGQLDTEAETRRRPEPEGKKILAEREAFEVAENSEWASLIRPN